MDLVFCHRMSFCCCLIMSLEQHDSADPDLWDRFALFYLKKTFVLYCHTVQHNFFFYLQVWELEIDFRWLKHGTCAGWHLCLCNQQQCVASVHAMDKLTNSFLPWTGNSWANRSLSRAKGTSPLQPPPVPALISNMSSHYHRWIQRKHFFNWGC